MLQSARRLLISASLAVAALTGSAAALAPASAQAMSVFTEPKYAAIVLDANSGEVLYAMRADALRHPASLTKIMTLYLTFEALSTGRLKMSDVITISPHAYSMMPSKVSTHPGETLTVAEAIPAMTVHSANDVAVAMAERISGSESRFAQLMTLRAHELGMTETSFVNASGLPPDGEQISSAHDMATLSRAVMRDYPQYYHFFGLKSFDFHGKTLMNHNHLVARMPGVDGMKTGYTSLAGFNLVASGVRGGHRLITVVLGGPSVAARDENVEELLDAGFAVLQRRAMGQRITLASIISAPDDMSGPIQRAPIEEGSADQPNLQVEVQPQMRTLPVMAAARNEADEEADAPAPSPKARLAAASATPDCDAAPSRKVRRHRRRARACTPADTTVAKADKSRAAKTAEPQTETAVDPKACAKHRRRHRAACEAADTQVAEAVNGRHRPGKDASEPPPENAKAESVRADGGGYMIQVGAYKSHALAKGQVDKLAAVVTGSGRVEKAGGNYRARFRGLSEEQAKAACHALSAKGQACMVMGAS